MLKRGSTVERLIRMNLYVVNTNANVDDNYFYSFRATVYKNRKTKTYGEIKFEVEEQ